MHWSGPGPEQVRAHSRWHGAQVELSFSVRNPLSSSQRMTHFRRNGKRISKRAQATHMEGPGPQQPFAASHVLSHTFPCWKHVLWGAFFFTVLSFASLKRSEKCSRKHNFLLSTIFTASATSSVKFTRPMNSRLTPLNTSKPRVLSEEEKENILYLINWKTVIHCNYGLTQRDLVYFLLRRQERSSDFHGLTGKFQQCGGLVVKKRGSMFSDMSHVSLAWLRRTKLSEIIRQ